jgi:hypothetical protein
MPGKPKKTGRFTRNVSPFHRPYRFAFQGGPFLRRDPETKRGPKRRRTPNETRHEPQRKQKPSSLAQGKRKAQMGEANRRRHRIGPEGEGTIKGTAAEVYAEMAAYLVEGSRDHTLMFGPVVWQPSDGTSARRWYFHVVGCGRTGEVWNDQLNAETEADTVALRNGIKMALIDQRPCVMHDFDDELEMARWAEAAWPCAKITRIRAGIEAERAAWKENRP